VKSSFLINYTLINAFLALFSLNLKYPDLDWTLPYMKSKYLSSDLNIGHIRPTEDTGD
jgi:hypothetical protein